VGGGQGGRGIKVMNDDCGILPICEARAEGFTVINPFFKSNTIHILGKSV
jgi:hypothetical protein